MAKRRSFTAYRDRLTGQLVSAKFYRKHQRARFGLGKRYVQVKLRIPIRPSKAPPPPGAPVYEWVISFTYEPSGRSFDVIVTARDDEHEAYSVAKDFLKADADASRIVRANFRNWGIVPARGKRTEEDEGKAEYRKDSKQ